MREAQVEEPANAAHRDSSELSLSPTEHLDSPSPTSRTARKDTNTTSPLHETPTQKLERLGRQRPAAFKSFAQEVGFVYAVVMSQAMTEYFVSGFNVLIPTVATELNISKGSQTWPANAFSLVVSALLLPFGRLADMYGGYPVYLAGVAWLAIWSVIAGFSQNEIMLDVCRALQGLGPAAYLPAGLMLLGSIYRPGPRKNVVFALYGALAVFGFYGGIFLAGVCAQYVRWGAYMWIGAGLTVSVFIVAYFTIPSDVTERRSKNVKMDIPGAVLIPVGLILVVFAITESAHAPKGWGTPYIIALFILGILILIAATYWEGWRSTNPLLPSDIFSVKYMKPLFLALIFSYGSFGIFLLYGTYYMTQLMGATPMQVVAWFTPMCLGGILISSIGGFFLHKIPGTILMCIAGTSWVISPLLFALAPPGANYWYFTFWSMVTATIGIDTTFTVSNIFITTRLSKERQGVAGAIINSVIQLSIAVMLGWVDVLASEGRKAGWDNRKVLKSAFWFEVAIAAAALVLMVGFVRLGEAKSEMTVDERKEMEEEIERDRLGATGVLAQAVSAGERGKQPV